MLDLTKTVDRFIPSGPAINQRRLLLVDHAGAHPRLLAQLQRSVQTLVDGAGDSPIVPPMELSPQEIILLWVVTPSAVMSWGALLAEPMEERTGAMVAALNERMEEARQRLVPLQRAGEAAGLHIRIRIAHGALVETLARVAREEGVETVQLVASNNELYGRPASELTRLMTQRLARPVEVLPNI